MVRLATVAVAMALVAVAASASESFYAAVENRLPSAGGMDLVCRDADASSVRCSWAYAGNYAAGITLLDTR
jgi:predicted lipoprotein with Yx(FWY)xxD motif